MSSKPTRIVLIIDASTRDCATYQRYLADEADYQYTVLVANSAALGLTLWRTHALDCVLLDYHLPDQTGIDVLKTLVAAGTPALAQTGSATGDSPEAQHHDDSGACAIVMLSSTGELPLAVAALKNGAHDYLEKATITRERLSHAINNAIEKVTLQHQLATQRQELARQNRLLTTQLATLQEANRERMHAEQARQQSEEMTQAVMQALTTQVALLNQQGVIIAVNEAWTRYALENGASSLERVGIGVNYLDVCRQAAGAHTAGAVEALAGIEAVLRGEQSLFTLEYPCPSLVAMHWYLLSVTQLPAPTGGAIVSHMEITDRKQAEERLRLLETAVLHSNESILITTTDLEEPGPTIVYVNPAFTRITGYTAEEVLGKNPRLLQGPKTERAVLDRLRRQCAAGEVFHGEAINYRKGGQEFYLEWSIAPVWDEKGAITHFVATQFDATTRKQQEAQLRQRTADLTKLNAELTHSNAELDAFAYVASHDLKEPLRGLSNYVTFLQEDYAEQLDETGGQMLQAMGRLTERMEGLLNTLLEYARLGRRLLNVQPTNAQQVLTEQLQLLQPHLTAAKVTVRLPSPLPVVQSDPVLLSELFVNLLTNAIKYNDKVEKWVEIGVQKGETKGAEAKRGAPPPSPPVFYVRDNGIGIPHDLQDEVFQIFRRLHGRDEFGGGMGAGLTIVKRIVERHKGRIWLESEPGEGTTFYFTLE